MTIGSLNSADTSVLLFTLGLLLIELELNRPGTVLAGAAGLLLSLLAVARVLRSLPDTVALVCCVLGLVLLVVSTRVRAGTRAAFAFGSTALLIVGYTRLVPARPHASVTWPCALLAGLGTSALTTIAARARQNKGLDLKRKAPRAPGASLF